MQRNGVPHLLEHTHLALFSIASSVIFFAVTIFPGSVESVDSADEWQVRLTN